MHCIFGHCCLSTIFILRRLKPSPLFSSQIISVKTLPPSVLIRRSTTDNTLQIVSQNKQQVTHFLSYIQRKPDGIEKVF